MLPLLRYFFAHLFILQYTDHHQNLISSSLYYSGPVHKISSQSVHNVLSNVVHRQTNRQTNRQTDKLINATKNITSFAKEVIKVHNCYIREGALQWIKRYNCYLGCKESKLQWIQVCNCYISYREGKLQWITVHNCFFISCNDGKLQWTKVYRLLRQLQRKQVTMNKGVHLLYL